MDLVVITGPGAVGKMTVGQELMKLTGFRLFHNHMMIEPVLDVFGKFDIGLIISLRNLIFDRFVQTDHPGMIFTCVWDFDMIDDDNRCTCTKLMNELAGKFRATGGAIYVVELQANLETRLKRNSTKNRLDNKPSKRDIEASDRRLLLEQANCRTESHEGDVPFKNHIKIDNTHLSAEDVARKIAEAFGFPIANT